MHLLPTLAAVQVGLRRKEGPLSTPMRTFACTGRRPLLTKPRAALHLCQQLPGLAPCRAGSLQQFQGIRLGSAEQYTGRGAARPYARASSRDGREGVPLRVASGSEQAQRLADRLPARRLRFCDPRRSNGRLTLRAFPPLSTHARSTRFRRKPFANRRISRRWTGSMSNRAIGRRKGMTCSKPTFSPACAG